MSVKLESKAAESLPVERPHKLRCGPRKASKRGPVRAAALILVHLAVLAHVAHWKITGRTMTPLEPSEAGQTLTLGYVNAGFILLVTLILLTLVVGRFFCGWACHVVAYQDLCAWLLGKLRIRPKPIRSRLLMWVPLFVAFEMFFLPSILQQWQGQEFSALRWHLTTESFWERFPGWGIGALTLLVDGFLVVYLLGAKGFCTYGCPYGALFGISDRYSRGRIRVTDACEGCGHCTATCTSNVRVHEEVALYKQVVDPGCMKCMDCVSVCPKDALYFGFGPARGPAVAKQKAVRRKVYDFSWPEELSMALIFFGALYAFRNLYGEVPFLLAVGMAVIAALAAVAGWRLLRRGDFSFQHHALRRAGRVTGAGTAAFACSGLMLLFTAHSAYVQYHTREGERLLIQASSLSPNDPARSELAVESLAHLDQSDRFGLFPSAALENQIGALLREQGRTEEAAERFRRAFELRPAMITPRLQLADIHMRAEAFDLATEVLAGLLEVEASNGDAGRRLAYIISQRPEELRPRLLLVGMLIASGDLLNARVALAPAVESHPEDPRVRELERKLLGNEERPPEAR